MSDKAHIVGLPGSNNEVRWLHGALFYEQTIAKGKHKLAHLAKYTLRDTDLIKDGVTYKSLYKAYMDMEDTTEYQFACTYVENWRTWQKLLETKWFKPHIERWREELALKLEARHLQKLRETADGDGRDSVLASKYLLEKAKQTAKSTNKRGRPSNKPSDNGTSNDYLKGVISTDLKLLEALSYGKRERKNTSSDAPGPGDVHTSDPPSSSTG